jgi:hypothetical protein
MAGSAMFTMLPSSVAMSEPSDTLVRISHLRSIEKPGARHRAGDRSSASLRCLQTLLDVADQALAADQGASFTTELNVSL